MEIDESAPAKNTSTAEGNKKAPTGEVLPESDVYVRLLLILGLIDVKEVEKVSQSRSVVVGKGKIARWLTRKRSHFGRLSIWPRRRRRISSL